MDISLTHRPYSCSIAIFISLLILSSSPTPEIPPLINKVETILYPLVTPSSIYVYNVTHSDTTDSDCKLLLTS